MSESPGQQGILSVLESDGEMVKNNSLCKTLSADISSKKWQTENNFSVSNSCFSLDVDKGEDKEREVIEDQSKTDSSWSSMLTQNPKTEGLPESSLPPPYIHPLTKKSANSLSTKSLEVCTESLGSETGFDGEEVLKKLGEPTRVYDTDKVSFEKYEFGIGKKRISQNQTFPRPIPTLCYQQKGTSVHMSSRRDSGRVVLEAVSMSSPNNFHAQREDGRLVLAFSDSAISNLGGGIPEVENGEEDYEMLQELDEGCLDFVQDTYKEEEIDCDDEVEDEQEVEPEIPSESANAEQLLPMTYEPISAPQSLPPLILASKIASPPVALAMVAAASYCGYLMPPNPPHTRNYAAECETSASEDGDDPLPDGKKRMRFESAPLLKGCSERRRSALFCHRPKILTA